MKLSHLWLGGVFFSAYAALVTYDMPVEEAGEVEARVEVPKPQPVLKSEAVDELDELDELGYLFDIDNAYYIENDHEVGYEYTRSGSLGRHDEALEEVHYGSWQVMSCGADIPLFSLSITDLLLEMLLPWRRGIEHFTTHCVSCQERYPNGVCLKVLWPAVEE